MSPSPDISPVDHRGRKYLTVTRTRPASGLSRRYRGLLLHTPFEPGTPIGADERLIQVPRGISSATVSQRPAALSSSQWCSSHARAGPWADRKVRAGKSATSGTLSPLGPSTSPSALLWTEGGARLDRACERNGVLS